LQRWKKAASLSCRKQQQTICKFRDKSEKEIKGKHKVINLSTWQDRRAVRSNTLELNNFEGKTEVQHSYIHNVCDEKRKQNKQTLVVLKIKDSFILLFFSEKGNIYHNLRHYTLIQNQTRKKKIKSYLVLFALIFHKFVFHEFFCFIYFSILLPQSL